MMKVMRSECCRLVDVWLLELAAAQHRPRGSDPRMIASPVGDLYGHDHSGGEKVCHTSWRTSKYAERDKSR
jgi:hypothetical protein